MRRAFNLLLVLCAALFVLAWAPTVTYGAHTTTTDTKSVRFGAHNPNTGSENDGVVSVPEIDPAATAGIAALLVGTTALLTSSRRRKHA